MNISAAQVVKMSAKQLFYLAKNPTKVGPPSKEKIAGVKYQMNVVDSPYVEMGGFITFKKNHRIYFTFDEVKLGAKLAKLYEHKMVSGNDADWYLKQSILQAAVYKALFLSSPRTLNTAKFYRDKTGVEHSLNLKNIPVQMYLKFGPTTYRIKEINRGKLLDWVYNKIASSFSWGDAVEFDNKYKHKEWEYLKSAIKYVQV